MKNYFFSKSLIGLDVKSHAIYLVQLRKNKHNYEIERMLTASLSQDIWMEGKIKSWEFLQTTLANLVIENQLQGMKVALSLPANLVRMQQIAIAPHLSDAEIAVEIDSHLQKDLFGFTDTLSFDYVKTPQTTDDIPLFFTAARKEYISQYTECVAASGLHAKIMDVDIYALQRAVCSIYPNHFTHAKTERLNAILSFSDMAMWMVFDDQQIRFYQQWDILLTTEWTVPLHTQMQLFFVTFPDVKIHQLWICGMQDEQQQATLQDLCAAFSLKTQPVDLQKAWHFHLPKKDQIMHEDFLIAYGLAMREVPRW